MSNPSLKVLYGQISPVVGDIKRNAESIFLSVVTAPTKYNVFLFPELSLVGYPPLDLLFRRDFIRRVVHQEGLLIEKLQHHLNTLGSDVAGEKCVIFGSVTEDFDGLLNSAVIVFKNRVERRHKTLLPTYDVFDERRWFIPAKFNTPVFIAGEWCGVVICEDVWDDKRSLGRDTMGPVHALANEPITHLFVLNASPWHIGKNAIREHMISMLANTYDMVIHYVNQVGGNDSLIFDGGSFACDRFGRVIFRCRLFETQIGMVGDGMVGDALIPASTNPVEGVYNALVYGTREYMKKTGFTKAVIASSGGIDSAVVIGVATAAIGANHVHTIAMPGPYSTDASAELARQLATNFGVGFEVVDIKPMYEAALTATDHFLKDVAVDVSNENLQARLRGLVAMKYSNRSGAIVLTTGNKSEMAVGYCTLYGDMCGGLAVIVDVPKMMVFELARYINTHLGAEIIPQAIIDRAPSAELAPDQKDSDSLPPYPILDAIIRCYVDEELPIEEFDPEIPRDVIPGIIRKIDLNEYKRQQAAPALKVTTKAFGIGRNRLITAHYRPDSD